jgi:chorismate synthase
MILSKMGVEVRAYTRAISDIEIDYVDFDEIDNPVYMPDSSAAKLAYERIIDAKAELDSVGGIIECRIDNLPAGLGEPVFDKFDANLAKAIMSIGGIRGFEIGDGFAATKLKGSENNDSYVNQNGKIEKSTNHSGGVLGGITDGSQVLFRAAVKPTPSIGKKQNTVTSAGDECQIEITGRHDPCIVPRAVVVVESMAAIATVDMIFSNMSARIDNIIDFIR